MVSQSCRQQQYALDLTDKSRHGSVAPNNLDVSPKRQQQEMEQQTMRSKAQATTSSQANFPASSSQAVASFSRPDYPATNQASVADRIVPVDQDSTVASCSDCANCAKLREDLAAQKKNSTQNFLFFKVHVFFISIRFFYVYKHQAG